MNVPAVYVDWHCRSCGHEHETTQRSWSHPVECPNCGEKTISRGAPVLPTNRVWCDTEPHQYSFTSDEKHIQVYMMSLAGKRCGVTLDPDSVPDCDNDPIEVVQEVLSILNRYIYTSSKERVEAVLNEMLAHKEESDKNAKINRIHELRKSIVLNLLEYNDLQQ